MAVSRMQRAQIFAHSSHRASLIRDLQNLEILHINSLDEQEETTSEAPAESEVRAIIRGMQNDLSRLQSTIDYLADFEPKKSFTANLFGGGIVLSSREYAKIMHEVDWRDICDGCQSLEDQAAGLTNSESRLRTDRERLGLWSDLDVPIEEIQDTEKTAIRIGVVPIGTYDNLLADLVSSGVDAAFDTVRQTKTEIHLVVIFLKEDEQEAISILTRYGVPSGSPTSGTRTSRSLGSGCVSSSGTAASWIASWTRMARRG